MFVQFQTSSYNKHNIATGAMEKQNLQEQSDVWHSNLNLFDNSMKKASDVKVDMFERMAHPDQDRITEWSQMTFMIWMQIIFRGIILHCIGGIIVTLYSQNILHGILLHITNVALYVIYNKLRPIRRNSHKCI